MPSKIVFGTMTFGPAGVEQARVNELSDCQAILDVLKRHKVQELDTARAYSQGGCEEYLRKLEVEKQGFKVATKNFPSARFTHVPLKFGKLYDHSKAGIQTAMSDSLAALGTSKVDLYYLHAPDRETPFEETIAAIAEEYKQGKFDRFGISNFTADEVKQVCRACEKFNMPTPSVYQGLYNAIARNADPELLNVLRAERISYYVYNPLGGGFFVGKIAQGGPVERGSRFDNETGQGKMYRMRYFHDAYFKALEELKPVCEANGVSLPQAALRWLQHHSALDSKNGDAIIIGASSVNHIDANLKDLEGEPLPKPVVDALDKAWADVKAAGSAPKYHF